MCRREEEVVRFVSTSVLATDAVGKPARSSLYQPVSADHSQQDVIDAAARGPNKERRLLRDRLQRVSQGTRRNFPRTSAYSLRYGQHRYCLTSFTAFSPNMLVCLNHPHCGMYIVQALACDPYLSGPILLWSESTRCQLSFQPWMYVSYKLETKLRHFQIIIC